jgi:uncharacterized membrane protein YgcG
MANRSLGTWLALGVGLIFAFSTNAAMADSHVRIVRLSNVQGAVEIDRNSGQGYEKATANMPLVEGMKLAAKADGRAEVEFEDGSTVRITPNSKIEFTTLSLQDSGAKVSTVTLTQGLAYVDYTARQKDNVFTVTFKDEKVRPEEAARFRVNLAEATAVVAVFNGELKVDGLSGPVEVSKNKSVIFDLTDGNKSTLAKNIEDEPYDAWDKQQAKYQQEYAKKGSYRDYPFGYGVSDLNYYGNYTNVPGYGMMWQPYFAGVGWDPFMDGSWMFYPGVGYTWVSAYPWGWMPYRYGSWNFVPGYGWMWAPGGFGGGWATVVPVTNPPIRYKAPAPPVRGTATVAVGRPVFSSTAPSRLVVRGDSAGLGVPRGTVSNMSKVARQVQTSGSATVRPAPAPAPGVMSPGFGNSGSHPSTGGSHASTGGSHMSTGGGRMSSGGGGRTSAPSRPH